MARIRTVKPEYWTDDAILECSIAARLLFIGIWNFADDDGNIERSSKQIKLKILPADPLDAEPLVLELLFNGLMVEYQVEGKKYLHICGFKKHQKINRPSDSKIPKYDHSLRVYPKFAESEVHIHGELTEDSLRTHGGLTEGREGKGRERKGRERKGKDISSSSSTDKEIETTLPIPDEVEQTMTTKMDVFDFRTRYQQTFNVVMPPMLNQTMHDLCRQYPKETLINAFEVTAANGGKTIRYLEEVLKGIPKGDVLDEVFGKMTAV